MQQPLVVIVVAFDRNGLIGADGGLPWHLPADLRHFRDLTMGKPLVMGRRTHESIGRPLPGRTNIVLSTEPGYSSPGCLVVPDFAMALERSAEFGSEVMVIGGAKVYTTSLPIAERIELTRVDAEFAGDTYFPPFARHEWVETARTDWAGDVANPHPYAFITLARQVPTH